MTSENDKIAERIISTSERFEERHHQLQSLAVEICQALDTKDTAHKAEKEEMEKLSKQAYNEIAILEAKVKELEDKLYAPIFLGVLAICLNCNSNYCRCESRKHDELYKSRQKISELEGELMQLTEIVISDWHDPRACNDLNQGLKGVKKCGYPIHEALFLPHIQRILKEKKS